MKRPLSITSIALLTALCSTGSLKAEISAPDRAFEAAATNNKLLNTASPSSRHPRRVTVPRDPDESVEQPIDSAGWTVSGQAGDYFFNVRKVIAQQGLMRAEEEINRKFYEANRNKKAVNSSA